MEPGGQLDMQQLLAAAAAMQSQLMNAQQELAEAVAEKRPDVLIIPIG